MYIISSRVAEAFILGRARHIENVKYFAAYDPKRDWATIKLMYFRYLVITQKETVFCFVGGLGRLICLGY